MISAKPSPIQTSARLFAEKKLLFSVTVLLIFHAVGFWGMLFSGDSVTYQNLTPLNLLLTTFLLFLNHKNFDNSFCIFAGITFIVSFLAEVIGVQSGLLFGHYWYGNSLGLKLWEVPLLIGLNWLVLVYSIGSLTAKLQTNTFLKAFVAAILMVGLDYFIEPAAMQFDFWHWKNNVVPLQNYVGWFLLAFILQSYFQQSTVYKKNPLAIWIFGAQATFFIALNAFQ